jgi:hypothetical protein
MTTAAHTNAAGFSRIATVEVETFHDLERLDNGTAEGLVVQRVAFEVVWIITTRGELYQATPRIGETAEGIAAAYRARGWIDANCYFERAA